MNNNNGVSRGGESELLQSQYNMLTIVKNIMYEVRFLSLNFKKSFFVLKLVKMLRFLSFHPLSITFILLF